jgi:hypothetical protein
MTTHGHPKVQPSEGEIAMIIKSLIAAGAVAAAVSAAAPAAVAKTNWDISVGIGVPAYPVYDVYDHDVYVPVRPRHPRHVDVVDDDFGISCRQGRRLVRNAGFRAVSAFDCDGRTYGYTAYRFGDMYRVRVDAVRGRIIAVRPTY